MGHLSSRQLPSSSLTAPSPAGTIPSLHEPDTGFAIAESNAIMAYLCNRHGWTDLYPDDWHQRAKVDWYLHFHHRTIRPASALVASRVRKDLAFPEAMLAETRKTFVKGVTVLNDGWLAESPYLTGDGVTIADIAAYCEIGQLQPDFTNLFDFSSLPNIQRWMNDMKTVDGHDDIHVVLSELGDISQESPTMDALKTANKNALKALKAKLEAFGA